MASISNRYAVTFYDLCKENNWEKIVYEDLKSIESLLNVSNELSDFIQNPVAVNNRGVVLEKIFWGKINVVTLRFLQFLEEKKHLYLFKEISEVFQEQYRIPHNILKVTIVSSHFVADKQIKDITEELKSKFYKNIEHDLIIDSSLIGGMKIYVGDTVYDFSFKTQLNRFKEKILMSV